MTFRNPILGAGGSTLLRPAIQSPNYSPGVAGWAIKRDGSAELNAVVIRNGETVGSTDLYYNGTPALGNLIASISEQSGTDQYGNTYLSGICTYVSGQSYTQVSDGVLYVGPMNGNSPATPWAASMGQASDGGLSLVGSVPKGLTLSGHHPAALALEAGASSVAVPNGAEPYVAVIDPQTAGQSVVSHHVSGAVLKTNAAGTVEQWQTPSLGSGWASGPVGGSYRGLQYRKDAEDNLILSGVVHCTSATPSATLLTLPSGYIPKSGERPGVVSNASSTYAARSIEISTAGAVVIDPVPTVTNTDVYIYASIPLGNIA